MTFLPENYELPESVGNYMRFEKGANKFRILDKAVIGYEGWKTQEDGSKKPVRKRQGEAINVDEVDKEDEIKHFWAFPVYNYQEEKVQILEITQKGIMKEIRALERSKDWGSPLEYDITVTRTGDKLETRYTVQPSPPKKLDPAITKYYKDLKINLDALFDNEDPFADSKVKNMTDEEIAEVADKVAR